MPYVRRQLLLSGILLILLELGQTRRDECIDSAVCNLLRADFARQTNRIEDVKKFINNARNEWRKFKKYEECLVEKINENCLKRGGDCLVSLHFQARQMSKRNGLKPNIDDNCPFNAFSYTYFLCKNTKEWNKLLGATLPEEFTRCNTTCMEIEEFERFHLRNGVLKKDFPPLWEEKKNEYRTRMTEARVRENKGGANAAPEPRQRYVPWNADHIEAFLHLGSEFREGEHRVRIACEKNTWINYIEEYLPISFRFSCVNWKGEASLHPILHYPTDQITEPLSVYEKGNKKGDISATRAISCKNNKFKIYQPEHALLVGMQFRIDAEGHLHSGKYLCAGDTIWTDWSRNVGKHERFVRTPASMCPVNNAICSLDVKADNGGLVQVIAGCCRVERPYSDTTMIFHTIKYNDPTHTLVGLTRSSKKHTYIPKDNSPKTYLCPANYFMDGFTTQIIQPTGISGCYFEAVERGDCLPEIFYMFTTTLKCNSLDKDDQSILEGPARYFEKAIGSNGYLTIPAGDFTCEGFYLGVEFSCAGRTLSKGFECPTSSPPFQTSSYRFPFSSGAGRWGLRSEIEFKSSPEFKYEAKCPPLHAICGVAGTASRPSSRSNQIETSIEGLYYDYLCCPVNLEICNASTISIKLERIPNQCDSIIGVVTNCTVTVTSTQLIKYISNNATSTLDKQMREFGITGGFNFNFAGFTASTALSYKDTAEKSKLYGFEESRENNTVAEKTTTVSFSIQPGRSLKTYQPYIYCGGYKLGSHKVISIQTPSTNCNPHDKHVVFNKVNGGSEGGIVNISFHGYGTLWTQGRDADQIDIPWKDISERLIDRFKHNFNFSLSEVTLYHWTDAPLETFNEYEDKEFTFPYTLEPGFNYSFKRVVGYCGDNWVVEPKVTAENVEVQRDPA